MMASKGRILQLQNYSVNDGEGIRTIVFFAGCPLRCQWCANPEGYTPQNHVLFIASRCIQCGRCTEVCPQGIGWNLNESEARAKCTGCGLCVDACLEQARKNAVQTMTVAEVVHKLESQLLFFRSSGGGVTYSGGECTTQPEFLAELVDEVYDMGLDQAMETSGYFELETLQPVLDKIDLLFIDIKVMDSEKHCQFTGIPNAVILDNIARLGATRKGIIIRVPTIMGVNGDDDNIRATARFVKEHLQDPKMELLPYHSYGADKYTQLGLVYDETLFRTPTKEEMVHLNAIIESEGVQVVSYA
ncbi:MAG: glycyl-radical enzyme activating protein [Megasphaera sp.]|jgi:pyruvate formate lyase activating enzyme|nr:glycyl-radical enzyme activating protein [Megasphaera sp.]MCH4187386.1 glycyl-radical enzyme activating protein [Megasphaera sp.]MCH4217568.1 glycyl-radical enzyme activating protein [Megasphaera sp.]